MKEHELRHHTICSVCSQRILARGGVPLFWRVRIERFGVDLRAVARQGGLEQLIGNVALAMVMGPDEDLAVPVMPALTLTVCEGCASNRFVPVAALAEFTSDSPRMEAG